jgi:hypothetical protein
MLELAGNQGRRQPQQYEIKTLKEKHEDNIGVWINCLWVNSLFVNGQWVNM